MAGQVRPKPHDQWYRPPGAPRVPVAGRPGSLVIPRPLRAEVLARDEHCCQRCGCSVRTQVLEYSLQHRRARGSGGSRHANFPANLITLCGSATTRCHGFVENAGRGVAMAQGFVVAQSADPAACAVLRFAATDRAVWSLLTDDGWSLADAPAVVDTWSAASLAHHAETGQHLTAAEVAALAVAS